MQRVPNICKFCGQSGTVKKVLYRLPETNLDPNSYILRDYEPANIFAECIFCGEQIFLKIYGNESSHETK